MISLEKFEAWITHRLLRTVASSLRNIHLFLHNARHILPRLRRGSASMAVM